MNKRGMTLMELLVYMAIVGIVVMVAGSAFTNSTKMRIRTEGQISANEAAENLGFLIRDDLAQMGAKTATTSSDEFISKPALVYMDVGPTVASPDSSSYVKAIDDAGKDSIAFRKVKYNENGSYQRVEQISWYLDEDGSLYRDCQVVAESGTGLTGCTDEEHVKVAEDVEKFVVTPATPSVSSSTELLFPINSDATDKSFKLISYSDDGDVMRANVSNAGSGVVSISGFASNYNEDGSSVPTTVKRNELYVADITTSSTSRDACKSIPIKKDSVYEISFSMDYNEDASRTFRADIDHMAVGIRKASGDDPRNFSDVPDFIFYPPQTSAGNTTRLIRFSSSTADVAGTNACVVFTFAFFSPIVSSGNITLRDLQVKRYGLDYEFNPTNPPTSLEQKKAVRAFQVEIVVKKNNEAGAATIVVPVPSNGVNG